MSDHNPLDRSLSMSLRWAERDAFWRAYKEVHRTTLFGKHYVWVQRYDGGNLRLVRDV